jgi:hypothetical protein
LTLQDLFALYSDLDAHVLDFGPYVFYPTSKIGSSVHDAASAVAMCGRISEALAVIGMVRRKGGKTF